MVLKLSAMPLTARGTIKLFSFFLWLLTLAGGSKLGMVGADDSSGFCRTSDWKFDLDAVNLFCIEEVKMATDESVILPFITEAMQRGLWECAAEALQAAAALGLSVWEIFLMEHRLLNKELSKLKRVAEHCKPAQTISPAFEWAESPDLIYMNVKFSHRLDAPATLDITPVVTILPNKLEIEGRKGTKEFSLELNLKNDVDPEKCNWTLVCMPKIIFISQPNPQRCIASNCTHFYFRGVLDELQLHFLNLKKAFGQIFCRRAP